MLGRLGGFDTIKGINYNQACNGAMHCLKCIGQACKAVLVRIRRKTRDLLTGDTVACE